MLLLIDMSLTHLKKLVANIAARRADKEFQKRLKRRLEEDAEVLKRLAQ